MSGLCPAATGPFFVTSSASPRRCVGLGRRLWDQRLDATSLQCWVKKIHGGDIDLLALRSSNVTASTANLDESKAP
jgi:hypothetical protein